jgi:hypothetical protein
MSDDDRPPTDDAGHGGVMDAGGMPGGAPPATFEFLVHTLFTQALLALGRLPNPITRQTVKNMATARHFVDMLALVEEKTKGNLDRDERRLLDEVQHQLRVLVLEETGRDPGRGGGA